MKCRSSCATCLVLCAVSVDDVDLATLGLQRNNLAQESHKLLGGMVGSSLTKDLAAWC